MDWVKFLAFLLILQYRYASCDNTPFQSEEEDEVTSADGLDGTEESGGSSGTEKEDDVESYMRSSEIDDTSSTGSISAYDNRVGGHRLLLRDEDGFILKSHSTQQEIDFYETLDKTTDPVLLELKNFTPKYGGTVTHYSNEEKEEITSVRLEDVTDGFTLPCIMDLKIGKQTWVPGSSLNKVLRQKAKYKAMRRKFGFAIPGFQFYDVNTGELSRFGRYYGHNMNPKDCLTVMYNFINGERGKEVGLIKQILEQLRKISSWFDRQTFYKFYGSSILMTYDASSLKEGGSVNARVRMIDFTFAIPNADEDRDENYNYGLKKLIRVFEKLETLSYSDNTNTSNPQRSLLEAVQETLVITSNKKAADDEEARSSSGKYLTCRFTGHVLERRKKKFGTKISPNNGFLIKPVSGWNETHFYESLKGTDNQVLLNLRQFTPIYRGHGMSNVEGREDIEYIEIENLARNFFLPCILVIRIGEQTWEPTEESNFKIILESSKYEEMKKFFGFSIPGVRYYDHNTNTRRTECLKFKMKVREGIETVLNFIDGIMGLYMGTVDNILEQLKRINLWFEGQRHFNFYNSSIVITYDRIPNLYKHLSKPADDVIRVRMVDFAHVVPNIENTKDENYLRGLRKLIELFQTFTYLYKKLKIIDYKELLHMSCVMMTTRLGTREPSADELRKIECTDPAVNESEEFIVKGVFKVKEIEFYENLENAQQPELLELKKIALQYGGIKDMSTIGRNKDIRYIRIENILRNFTYPCIMDVKIGEQTFASSEVTSSGIQLPLEEAGIRWKFYIVKYRYYDVFEGEFISGRNTSTGSMMNSHEEMEAIFQFVNGKLGFESGLIESIIFELRKISSWFERQRIFKFYNTSLLIAYDAFSMENKNSAYGDDDVRVRLTNFTNLEQMTEDTKDENFVYGLEKLIELFENLMEVLNKEV